MKFFNKNLFFLLAIFLISLSAVSATQVVKDETIASNGGSGTTVSCPTNYEKDYTYNTPPLMLLHCIQKVEFAGNGEYVVNSVVSNPIAGDCPSGQIAGSPFTDASGTQKALCTDKLTVPTFDSGRIVLDSRFKEGSCTGGYTNVGTFTIGSKTITHCVQYSSSGSTNPACSITNLRWVDSNRSEVTSIEGFEEGSDRADGEKVYLIADASSACQDGSPNFRFKISSVTDGISVSDTYLQPTYQQGGFIAVLWENPKWVSASSVFSDNTDEPIQYKFTAYLNNVRTSDESGLLTVNRPGKIQCDSDSDCEDGQVCSGGRCSAECSTDSDCEDKYSGDKDFCSITKGMCIECRTNSDCSSNETCSEDGRCFNPQSECKIDSVSWLQMNQFGKFTQIQGGPLSGWIDPTDPNADDYQNGASISASAVIRGPPECRDRITFDIYEDDAILDDFVGTIQGNQKLKWQLFKPLWDSAFIGFFEGSELEYKFIAKLTNDEGDVTDSKTSAIISIIAPEEKECSVDSDCDPGFACQDDGSCTIECQKDSDCSGGDKCMGSLCVECYYDENDDLKGSCNAGLPACSTDNKCVECAIDSDCEINQICNSDNQCVRGNVSSCVITELDWIDPSTDTVVSRKILNSGSGITVQASGHGATHTTTRVNSKELDGWKEGFDPAEGASGEMVLAAKVADNSADTIENGCDGQKIYFEVYEDKYASTDGSQAASDAISISKEDKAAYFEWDGFDWVKTPKGGPEYYFNAWISGFEDQKVKSNTLKATEPKCSNNDQCLDNYACFNENCVEDKRCTGTITGIKYGICESDDDCFTFLGAQKCKG